MRNNDENWSKMKKVLKFKRDFIRKYLNSLYTFFIQQPHFRIEPQVATESAKNEAERCYKVDVY